MNASCHFSIAKRIVTSLQANLLACIILHFPMVGGIESKQTNRQTYNHTRLHSEFAILPFIFQWLNMLKQAYEKSYFFSYFSFIRGLMYWKQANQRAHIQSNSSEF